MHISRVNESSGQAMPGDQTEFQRMFWKEKRMRKDLGDPRLGSRQTGSAMIQTSALTGINKIRTAWIETDGGVQCNRGTENSPRTP